MSQTEAHAGKLRGAYARSFYVFSAFLVAFSFFVFVRGNPYYKIPIIMVGSMGIIGMYMMLRVSSAYTFQNGWDSMSKIDAWIWLSIGVAYFLITALPVLSGFTLLADTPAYYCILLLTIISILIMSLLAGKKLAWLAGDDIGGRSTFLRFLQLYICWISFNYILLHTREPKRPRSDHP